MSDHFSLEYGVQRVCDAEVKLKLSPLQQTIKSYRAEPIENFGPVEELDESIRESVGRKLLGEAI
jgi:hypothetical protein